MDKVPKALATPSVSIHACNGSHWFIPVQQALVSNPFTSIDLVWPQLASTRESSAFLEFSLLAVNYQINLIDTQK